MAGMKKIFDSLPPNIRGTSVWLQETHLMGEEDLDCDARGVFVFALIVSDTVSLILFSVCFRCVLAFLGRERGGAAGPCLRVFIVYAGAEAYDSNEHKL